VGKHVEDVIENTRMNHVIETGEAEIGGVQEIRGNKMVAMRMPLKVNGKIIGSVGKVVFKDISDFHSMSNKLNSLEKEIEFYKNELVEERTAKYSITNIIGESDKIKKVKSLIRKVAKTDSNVLIIGESGTGKELTAHAIHNESKRRTGPIIMVNCGAIPANLLESELFGYEEGAFTGAKKGGKKGKFQLANGGTIFLDEIGDMPPEMQIKLLRVIQERQVEKVGGSAPEEIDVRIIAATNRNLEKKVKEEEFREDLYYRLNVVKIELPWLRERKEDIPAIANSLRVKISERTGIYVEGISNEAMDCLMDYDWPGNIRELENIIERAIILLESDIMIKPYHLPEQLTKHSKLKKFYGGGRQLKDIVQEIEKDVILECLKRNKWNKNKTSQILGISRAGLYGKIDEYGLVEDSLLQKNINLV
jgi:transcriptional regulator with PAS, ATPase and Fis domain